MQALIENIKEDLKKYNIVSKYILKIGTSLIAGLILLTVSIKIYSVHNGVTFATESLICDLLECIKESFGSIYFSAFLLEMLHLKLY